MIRYDEKLRKITFIDWFLHCLGFHLVRTSVNNQKYCRICGKVFP